jgi:hypothetical protein
LAVKKHPWITWVTFDLNLKEGTLEGTLQTKLFLFPWITCQKKIEIVDQSIICSDIRTNPVILSFVPSLKAENKTILSLFFFLFFF